MDVVNVCQPQPCILPPLAHTFHLHLLPQLHHHQPLRRHPQLEAHQGRSDGCADDAALLEALAQPHVVVSMEVGQHPGAVVAHRPTGATKAVDNDVGARQAPPGRPPAAAVHTCIGSKRRQKEEKLSSGMHSCRNCSPAYDMHELATVTLAAHATQQQPHRPG
jgi:hypothetical protein